MSRRGCLIHYQRNVQRVTNNPSIVPEDKRGVAYERLMFLASTSSYPDFWRTVESLYKEFPELAPFLDWYLRNSPRSMLFLACRPQTNVQVHAPTNTNAVEGRNSANKEFLKNLTYDQSLRYLAEDMDRAWKHIHYVISKTHTSLFYIC